MSKRALTIFVACVATLTIAATAASAAGLSSTRFEAIERVYAVVQPLNESNAPVTAKQLQKVRVACATLKGPDPLLGSQRRVCVAAVSFLQKASATECATKASCVTELRAAITSLRALITATERDNRVINVQVDGAACQRALRTPAKDVVDYKKALRGFGLMERGLRTDSQETFANGRKLVESTTTGSSRDALAALRKHCR